MVTIIKYKYLQQIYFLSPKIVIECKVIYFLFIKSYFLFIKSYFYLLNPIFFKKKMVIQYNRILNFLEFYRINFLCYPHFFFY